MRARSFRYVHEAGSTHWQSPEETASRGAGDCKDKSIWLYAHLKQSGYSNVQLVIGRYRDIDRVLHAWVTYTDQNGNTILLDPAKQKRAWSVGEFSPELYKSLYFFDGQNRYRAD
ncbi:MAG: transglutaminase-like cysteine peptidase [Micavibrio sp.]|nr:transglutaminase-like cysteine peptidase [Micavibrio sp.]